ncbi:FK506-binding protein 59 isoform X2 [Sitodiplosis mosellana]|nr:FK506-binding protein 59 isoform X2 [Sitodiplosis mosellana]
MVEETNVIEENQIDLSGDGGVLKKILQESTSDEQPSSGCKVSLHYTGTLLDGTKFDSSLDRNEPFEFELGKGVVVKGFDMGVSSMKKGEKAVFTFKSEYAYGASGSPPNIPPNATLIFEIELLDWKPEDLSPRSNGGILRHVIKKPITRKTPNDGASVTVNLIGSYEGRVFDERNLTFSIGEVPDDEVISGVQKALTHFGKNETSRLIIKPEYAFGEKGHEAFGIPPNATVEYTVTLTEFEREPESWKLNAEESLAQAKLVKDKATGFLKQEKYELAIKLYEKANSYLSNCISSKGGDEEPQKVKAAVFSNIALCHLKLKNYYEVKKACETVLEIDSNNVKAYFRRGTAVFETGDAAGALEDFSKVQQLEPENKAALNQITLCKQEIKRQTDKEKRLYANMFAKFADADTK